MADEKITIGIEVDQVSIDRDSLEKEVGQIESDLGQSTGLFENMVPEVSNLFKPLVQNLRAGVEDVSRTLKGALSGEKIGEDVMSGLNASVGTLTANLANLKLAASEIGQAFKAIPSGMEADFNKSLNDMMRTAQSTLDKTYGMGGASRSVSGYATTLKNDSAFGASFNKTMQKYGLNEDQREELLQGVVRRVVPAMRNMDISDAAVSASRGSMKRVDFVPTVNNFMERLPARYRNLPLNLSPTEIIPPSKESMYEGNLTPAEYNKVKMVAENNDAFERALRRAGVARRGTAMDGGIKKAGVLQMPAQPISRRQYAEALGYMFSEELVPALEGAPAYYHPVTSLKASDTKAIAAKNSAVPAAVYSAAAQLDSIDVDPLIMPKGSKSEIDSAAFKKGTVALTANAAKVRPNMYQIMSLSYDDFAAGKIIDTQGETQNQFDDTATGRSVNKIIYQSGFTDLIGMRGNLSNGEGGKENVSAPLMLQIDMSDRIRKKDSEGNLVFENGMPVMDDEGRALVSGMFQKTKQMTYMRNGKDETYSYAAIPYGENGESYVPTNVKDGKVTMVREADYIAASRPWLEQFGVNVFDAFEKEDTEYANLSKFSKAFDVRNRYTTPSVPLEQLGGRMPGASKIGFVDASIVKGLMKQNGNSENNRDNEFALDGAFFAMPGYIPGGAGVVRAPGIKGSAVGVDFKQIIRDVYGDVDEFLIPGINAPQEMKDEYVQNGLEGVRKKYSSEDVSKYFVDAMQKEMLITDSVLKSSLYTSGETQEEMQQVFDTVMKLSGGMRIHKTASDYWSTQNSLSAQVSEKLDLSPEELQENADKWTAYIGRLEHDPMFAVRELFSNETDPLSVRVKKNPALLNQDPEAQLRLQNAIDSAKNSMLYNEMFAKGDASMGLALPNPGEFFFRVAEMNGLPVVDTNLYGTLGLGDSKIAVPKLSDSLKLGGLRYPNNQGEQQSLENDKVYIDLVDKYGMSRDAVYMNSKTIGKMGGGDFDGDTVQLIQGKLAEIIARTYENRGKLMEGQKRKREDLEKEPEEWNRKANSEDVADFLYRQATAAFQMGAVSNANESLSQIDWSNPEHAARYAQGAKDLELMYDIDSTFQKSGIIADWTAAAKEARHLGRPFATMFKGLQGIADNPTPENFEKLGDFSKVNFASKYNGLTASMLTALAANPLSSGAVNMMIEAQSDLQGIPALKASGVGYKQKQAEFLELNNRAMAEELTRGAIPSTETIEKMKSALTAWGVALGSKEDGFEGWQTRKPENMDDEQRAAVDAYRRQVGRIKFLETLGLNQRSVESGEGYAAAGFFKNNPLDTDKSTFQSEFDAQKDSQRAKAAIIIGANKDSLLATKKAGENFARIAAAKQLLNNMTFSYSSLSSFVDAPEKWFDRYVEHNDPEDKTPETMLGSLTHKVQEIWAKDRIAAGGIEGARSADEYEAIFRSLLSGDEKVFDTYGLEDRERREFLELKDAIGYDPRTGKYDENKVKESFKSRFQNSLSYVRELPGMLKDLKIEGTEVVTSPNFGEGGRSNFGKIDLVASDPKTGKLIAFDTKPSQTDLQIGKAKEQVMIYNARGGMFVPETSSESARFAYGSDRAKGARPFERGGVISYNIPSTGNPEDRVKMFDIDEQENAEIEKDYQERKAQVVRYAERGFDRDEIKNHTYRMSTPAAPEVEAGQEVGHDQPAATAATPQQVKVEIDPHSGRAVAQEITLQQGVDSYLEKMTGAQSQLLSLGRRKENPRVPNQWLNYDFMLNAGYDKEMEKLNAMGLTADDPRRMALVKARDDAKAEFDRALSISSIKDIENANEALQNHFSKGEIDSSAAGFAKEYDSLTESVSRATQALDLYKQQTKELEAVNDANKASLGGVNATLTALNVTADGYEKQLTDLLSKIEAAQDGSDEKKKLEEEYNQLEATAQKNVEKINENEGKKESLKRKIETSDKDLAARKDNIERADVANDELNKTLKDKQAYVSNEAKSYFEKQIRSLQVKTTGEDLTPEEIAAGKKDELVDLIESFKKGLAENVKKGVLTKDQEKDLLSQIESIDATAYGEKIEQQLNFQKEQEEKSYKYKQAKLARERENEIATARERNEARREGKPVDSRKHAERQYEAKLAELEEQRRVLHDRVWEKSLPQQERDRALEERKNLDKHISEVKENHDETLRVNAVADIRDLNDKLVKENSTRGADSFAVEYAQQFENLSRQIEEATASYDALQKKIKSGRSTKADKDAFGEAGAKLEELKKNADEKRKDLADQFDKTSADKLDNLQHLATGKDYTPAEIAQMKRTSLQEQIKSYVAGQRAIGRNAKIDNNTRVLANIRANKAEAIDLDAYEEEMREQLELEQKQKERQEELRKNRILRQAEKRTRDPYGRRRNTWWGQVQEQRDNAKYQLEDDREQLEAAVAKQKSKMSHMKVGTEEYEKAESSLKELQKQLEETGNAADKLDRPFGTASSAASRLAESAGKIAVHFGKQLFQKAIQEAKQFVKEWNASMTEIQMVTGKTSTEMDKLSESLVDTAVNMRVSPTDVSSTAVDLYRQGLSDDEVSERMEDVIKFSKVANISVEEASKMLTTAMSNGLVDSTEEAMDAMVALGDSAATTASEISKGMQKSAAAAKEAGVSYEQLLTMLTIVTSKTQLGGSNAGSAMQMMFSRLYKIGSGEEIYDENHNRIFESDATKALAKFGVNIFDDEGNFRDAYSIIMELAQNWDKGTDTEQEAVLDTLGAGRQRSNVATLLQGLAEDDGELAAKYMDLAENSGGITGTKYEAYYESLQAAIDNVTASFDQLVESLSADDAFIGFFNFIAEIIQGLTELTEDAGAATTVILTLGAALVGLVATSSPIGAVVAAVAALAAMGGVGNWLFKENEPVDGIGNLKEDNERTLSYSADTDSFLDRLDELNNKENRTTEETAELEAGLAKLAAQFGVTVSAADVAAGSFDKIAQAIAEAREQAAKYTVQELRFNLVSNADDIFNQAALETVNLRSSEEKNTKKFLNKNKDKKWSSDNMHSIGDELSDNFVEYMLKDAGFSGLMESFGLTNYGISTTEDFKALFNDGMERSEFFNNKTVQQRLASFTDENGNLKYYDKNNELNEDLVVQDMGKAFVGYMAEHYGDYEADTVKNNQQAWIDMLTDIIIESLAGNTSLDDKQIREIATVKASELASGIMAAGSYSEQLEAGRSAINEATNFVFDGYSGYQEGLDTYVENNARTWSVTKKDGSVVTGLTKTEAENVDAVEYGTRYNVIGANSGSVLGVFENEEDAEQFQQQQVDYYNDLASKGWGEKYSSFFDGNGILKKDDKDVVNLISALKNGYNPNTGRYEGEYTELWDALARKSGLHLPWNSSWSNEELLNMLSNGTISEADIVDKLKTINQRETRSIVDDYERANITQTIIDDPTTNGMHIENTGLLEEEEQAAQEAAIRRSTKFLNNVDDIIDSYETSDSNSGKYAADKTFEEMMAAGVTSLDELGKAIDEGLIGHIENAIQAIPELGIELDKLIERDSEGNWVGVKSGVDADAAFAKVLSLLASGSLSYADAISVGQTDKATLGLNAWKAVKGGQDMSEVANLDHLKEIIGADLYAEIAQLSSSIQGKNLVQRSSKIENGNNIRQITADGDYGYYTVDANEEGRAALINGMDQDSLDVVDMLLRNYLYGIDGLTTNQSFGLQNKLMNAFMSGNVSSLNEGMMSYYTNGNADMALLWGASKALEAEGLSFNNLDVGMDGYEHAEEILERFGLTTSKVKKLLSDLNKTMSVEGVRASNAYEKATDKVASKMESINSSELADNIKSSNSALKTLANNKYYRNQWRNGNTKSEIKSQIASQIGVDETMVDQLTQEVVDSMLNAVETQDVDNYIAELNAEMSNLFSDAKIEVPAPEILAEGGDMSGLISYLNSMQSDAASLLSATLSALAAMNGYVTFETYTDSNGKIGVRVKDFKAPSGVKSGGGGGGGGGSSKSAGAKLIEEIEHENTLSDHKIKMIQYEETRYQNAGELTNYGIMLQHEIDAEKDYAKQIEANIERMKQQLAATKKGSDEWYELRDAILSAEESYSEINNTIAENTKKQEENNQAILKTHTDLEQVVKDEIETRRSEERDMLDGQVSLEQTIVDAIRNRYEEEWELMQKDIDKKKKALQEEIDLIDERLQRRKDAEDEAEKYEELAEYKRQLALISTDSTRTKDQAELREKIAELEKELAWDEAEEEADLQKEGLQDQIDAYDEYVDDYQEYLDDLLENANNFADEVNAVMKMSHEDMIDWLKKNVDEYGNSLQATQKQMSQGWTDTFKQMKGIIDTFWEEIAQTLSSKYSFLDYMHNSSAYKNASEDERKQMDYNWGKMYDEWIDANKVDPDAEEYDHDDSGYDVGNDGGDNTQKTETLKFGFIAEYGGKSKKSQKDQLTWGEAKKAGQTWVQNQGNSDLAPFMSNPTLYHAQIEGIQAAIDKAKEAVKVYKTGGMVDYTGPAWVDGTKSRPEAFLSAEDTQMIRTLIDGWKYVATRPTITSIDGLLKDGSTGNTIGDVYVTLNEAQFNTDEDYELVAQKVGEAFTKELAKNGFTTASYSF